jgi:hypothetical protein
MYGVVDWSDPGPFAVPSVVVDAPLPGWCHKYTSERAAKMAQTLTVPLEPSFVPFGFFCMTAVADFESLMGAG